MKRIFSTIAVMVMVAGIAHSAEVDSKTSSHILNYLEISYDFMTASGEFEIDNKLVADYSGKPMFEYLEKAYDSVSWTGVKTDVDYVSSNQSGRPLFEYLELAFDSMVG